MQGSKEPSGWTATTVAGQTPEAPTLDLDPPKTGGDHSTRGSFQVTLAGSAVGTNRVMVFPLPDRLFHRLLTSFLDLLFHLTYVCACFDFHRERYLYLHERILPL